MDDDTSSVSVLIRTGDLGDRLPKIVTALDDQSLPYSRYQTIFLDPGSSDGTSRRLRELQRRRPNVRVLQAQQSTWRSAVEAATGDFVLLLGPDDLLFPDGLAALLDAARPSGSDAPDLVLAAAGDSRPVGFDPDTLTSGEAIDPSAPGSGIAVLAPFALVRRAALLEVLAPDEPNLSLRQTRLALLRSAGSLASCPVPVGVGPGPMSEASADEIWADAARAAELLDDGDAAAWFVAAHATAALEGAAGTVTPAVEDQIVDLVQRHWKDRDPDVLPVVQQQVVQTLVERDLRSATSLARAASRLEISARSASAEWSSGVLNLVVNGTISAEPAIASALPDSCRIQLSVRNTGNSLQYDLPTESTLDPSPDGAVRLVTRARVDVGRAAHGSPLGPGVWQLVLRLAGTGASRSFNSDVPFCAVNGAIVDGTPVGVFQADGRLRLDVGARRHGFLGAPYRPNQARISQTARGALLTITAPDLAVRGDRTIPSALFLGNLCLPAVFRASDAGAQIECYVSGLAGVSKLDAKVGDAVREPLGLQLRIGAVGDMAVEAAAPARKGAPAQPAPKPATPKAESRPVGNQAGASRPVGGDGPKRPAHRGPKPTKQPGPAKKAGANKQAGGRKRSGRVVNRLPEPLRPLARQAARSALVRRVYRQVVRRD